MKINATSDTKLQTATSGLAWDEIQYIYDALGRRLAKIATENGNFKRATRFIYDGWNVVEERTERQGAGGISKFLFWGEDLSGSFQGAGGVGGLVAHMEKPDSAGWTAYYYHPDANGNIAAVTSPFRALAAKFSYDAFGRTTSQSGPKSGIDIHALNYRFSTKPMELELATSNTTLVPPPVSSGLYYYGYRFYSPNMGRWINKDPIREQGGQNLYNFVGNDGVDKWDILGLEMPGPGDNLMPDTDNDENRHPDCGNGWKLISYSIIEKKLQSKKLISLNYAYTINFLTLLSTSLSASTLGKTAYYARYESKYKIKFILKCKCEKTNEEKSMESFSEKEEEQLEIEFLNFDPAKAGKYNA